MTSFLILEEAEGAGDWKVANFVYTFIVIWGKISTPALWWEYQSECGFEDLHIRKGYELLHIPGLKDEKERVGGMPVERWCSPFF